MAGHTVPRSSAAESIGSLLESPEIAALVSELDELRWTGRKGYGARTLVAACLVKSIYAIPTWTKVAALIAEHEALRAVCGGTPSQWALYRFTVKLRENAPLLAACLDRVTAALTVELPEVGKDVAIDASDLPAWANGQRFLRKGGPERETFSDPHASWGHRSAVSTRSHGGFYGYRVHLAVCAKSGLPLAWRVRTGRENETLSIEPLLDALAARGFTPETVAMDKAYDLQTVHESCEQRGVVAITPLRKTPEVKRGAHLAPECEHGRWTFAGADFKRKRSKHRCPSGACEPKSTWIKASRLHPLVPRDSRRFTELYRGAQRSSASSAGSRTSTP